jgi:cytochrome P450
MINSMDPPEHSKLRGKISRFFMPRRVRELESFVLEVVTELFDTLQDQPRFDIRLQG